VKMRDKAAVAYKTQRRAIFGSAPLAIPSESYFIFG